MGYRIKTVADMTGVPRSTLLAWERRHGVVEPGRQDNGYREYTDADVAAILELKRMVDLGHKVSEAIALLSESRTRRPPAPERRASRSFLDALGQQILQALLDFDRRSADLLVRQLSTIPYEQAILGLYFPMLKAVGDGWEAEEITIPQEHYASQFVREQLVGMLLNVRSGPADGPHALCAGYPGERHDLALLGIGILLALRGCRITLLGADVPLGELSQLAARLKPELVCVSVMQPRTPEEVAAYLEQLRPAVPEASRVVVGGAGLPGVLPSVPGVELYRGVGGLLGHGSRAI